MVRAWRVSPVRRFARKHCWWSDSAHRWGSSWPCRRCWASARALTALVDRPVALMLPWPHLAAVGACAVLALAAALASARLALRPASG